MSALALGNGIGSALWCKQSSGTIDAARALTAYFLERIEAADQVDHAIYRASLCG